MLTHGISNKMVCVNGKHPSFSGFAKFLEKLVLTTRKNRLSLTQIIQDMLLIQLALYQLRTVRSI